MLRLIVGYDVASSSLSSTGAVLRASTLLTSCYYGCGNHLIALVCCWTVPLSSDSLPLRGWYSYPLCFLLHRRRMTDLLQPGGVRAVIHRRVGAPLSLLASVRDREWRRWVQVVRLFEQSLPPRLSFHVVPRTRLLFLTSRRSRYTLNRLSAHVLVL